MPKAAKEKAPAKEKKAPAKRAAKEPKEKKAKKAKDPNAPKKPLGAYMFFCKEARPKVKEEHPEMKMTDVGKELGQLWGKMSDKDKEKYQKQAAKDKERYEKEMKSYKPSDDGDAEEPEEEEDEAE